MTTAGTQQKSFTADLLLRVAIQPPSTVPPMSKSRRLKKAALVTEFRSKVNPIKPSIVLQMTARIGTSIMFTTPASTGVWMNGSEETG